MRFSETKLAGAYLLDPVRLDDERGFFARTWSVAEMEERGLDSTIAQCSLSWNRTKGTLRGMHFQRPPFDETKLVRCTRGAISDVIIDLRHDAPTFRQWVRVELSAENRRLLYIPKGFAHGFLTLTDDVEVAYQLSAPYSAEHAAGVRWDDAAFGIDWPGVPTVISERDRNWSDFDH